MREQGPLFTCVWLWGESRDHFNHKGKRVLISSLQTCQDEWMMQQRRFDIRAVDGAVKRHRTSTLQPNVHRTFCGFRTSNTISMLHGELKPFMERILSKQFSHIVSLLSAVQRQSLTAAPVIKTSVEKWHYWCDAR